MIFILDNYDSFTYNLVQYFGELEQEIQVFRNDAIDVEKIRALQPDRIVVSPGPCTPREAGISTEVIRALGPEIPTLGVCLGHQCIGAAYGGNIVRADRIMHGKVSQITHQGNRLFEDIPSPFEATRYHSLIVERESCRTNSKSSRKCRVTTIGSPIRFALTLAAGSSRSGPA